MEYWQRRYIEENLAFIGTAGLLTVDLPNKGLLGCVEFRTQLTHGAAANVPDCWAHDFITKVELIVNGSQVVKSLTGDQLLAMDHYQNSYHEGADQYNNPNTRQREYFLINLGRFYHDKEYMLDLSRVNDPELRITYDFTLTGHHGWVLGAAPAIPPAPQITVIPHLLRETDKYPKGYIKTSEVYRFTSAPSRNENMTIPRGPTYCGLYLQSRYTGQGIGVNFNYIEANIDNGRLIPFRVQLRDLDAEVVRRYGEFIRTEVITGTHGAQYPVPFENAKTWESNWWNTDVIGCFGFAWGGWWQFQGHTISGYVAPVSGTTRKFTWKGQYPYSVAKLPFLNDMEPETWINSAELGDFWIRVEENVGAGALATIILLADEVVTQ